MSANDAGPGLAQGLTIGADSRVRCSWVGADSQYLRYHDEEWGSPLHGDRALFEKLSLEGFQAGLSWITILRKRDTFRRAFGDFEPTVVADFTSDDVERLMAEDGIVRNHAKILATIGNAQLVRDLIGPEPGSFDRLMWSFAPARRSASPATASEIPASTPESEALSRELKRRGFRFVGPTTLYALMQSSGMVDDHVAGCWRSTSNTEVDTRLAPPPRQADAGCGGTHSLR